MFRPAVRERIPPPLPARADPLPCNSKAGSTHLGLEARERRLPRRLALQLLCPRDALRPNGERDTVGGSGRVLGAGRCTERCPPRKRAARHSRRDKHRRGAPLPRSSAKLGGHSAIFGADHELRSNLGKPA